jgi:hypothetical protein
MSLWYLCVDVSAVLDLRLRDPGCVVANCNHRNAGQLCFCRCTRVLLAAKRSANVLDRCAELMS